MAIPIIVIIPTFLVLVLIVIGCLNKYKRLEKTIEEKNKMIETMIYCMPRLLDINAEDINHSVSISDESDFIQIKLRGSDKNFTGKLYNYFSAVRLRGFKLKVDCFDGTTRNC